ncbi:hypothetical protein J3A83DRAFT_4398005 [Scleroderma citrinum]
MDSALSRLPYQRNLSIKTISIVVATAKMQYYLKLGVVVGVWLENSVYLSNTNLLIVPPTRGPAQNSLPDLLSLTSLSPLHGHCSVITASVFFQLFTEEQVHLARALAGLLSPEPGSLICSVNMGAKVKGLVHYNTTGKDFNLFPHLEELWDGTVFEKGEIDVWAKYGEVEFMGEKILICFANSLSRRNKVSSDTRHQE